jgi:hypothetical protein
MTRPHIDHSLLSPNGRISKRARQAELDRVFGGENRITTADLRAAALAARQPTQAERLLRQPANLRELAARRACRPVRSKPRKGNRP